MLRVQAGGTNYFIGGRFFMKEKYRSENKVGQGKGDGS
jgi:hypothetical protein